MALRRSAWLIALIVSALSVMADTSYQVETSPADSPLVWQSNLAMNMRVSASSADATGQTFTVVPLAVIPGQSGSSNNVSFSGLLVKATTTNYVSIASASDIAFLSCDSLNNSYIDANRMLNALIANLPVAIVLYSLTDNTCKIDTSSEVPYQAIFSMIHSSDATQALSMTSATSTAAQAIIVSNSTNMGNTGSDTPTSSNSAVAMSILYSITGIITLLFLIIIATGAIRAHRYPERYGPRGAYGGRPRQSRAKGIARAVLETIPIVKFGDNTPAKPDPSVELENASGSSQSNHGPESVHDLPAQPHHLSAIPEDAAAQPKDINSTVTRNANGQTGSATDGQTSGLGVADINTEDADEHLGCSICTEDFTVGEDVRVLPCNHKFHPACIDPWLVNVSGTCPLCRLDLHPPVPEADETASSGEGSMHLPPPLEAEDSSVAGAESAATTHHRLHAPRLFDISRLRHASAEERLEVLRRYRSEHRGASEAGTGEVESEHGQSATLTRRLRERFRIRTRVLSPASESRAETYM